MTRAQAAYEAYAGASGARLSWDALSRREQQAWELAAEAAASWHPTRERPPRTDGRVERFGGDS